nr:hypothetical protein [Stenotrophomonas sp. MMGLT7]
MLPALLAVATAACSGLSTKPDSVPTRIKAGQSWVITRQAVAEQVLDTCSRDSPAHHPGRVAGYWAPSRQQVEQLEARQQRLAPRIAEPESYDRQYVGIVAGGRQLVYLNAFRLPDHADIDPAREALRGCDGAAGFWGALYDPETGEFSEIEVDGVR